MSSRLVVRVFLWALGGVGAALAVSGLGLVSILCELERRALCNVALYDQGREGEGRGKVLSLGKVGGWDLGLGGGDKYIKRNCVRRGTMHCTRSITHRRFTQDIAHFVFGIVFHSLSIVFMAFCVVFLIWHLWLTC